VRKSTYYGATGMRLILCIVAAVATGCMGTAAKADDLANLYAQVLKNPGNSEINLRYAHAAEEAGKLRWALAAYERITTNDPGNAEAQQGLSRIRRRVQPNTTQYTVEIGSAFESNPRYSPNSRGEVQGFTTLGVRDERTLGDIRWRTNALATSVFHQNEGDLNYGYAGATTGPVFGFIGGTDLVLGFGGGAATFDHRFFYGEGLATAAIEGYYAGALQTLQFRAGYRDYDSFFPVTNGNFYDIKAKFALPNLFADGNLFTIEPWVRWSAIGGLATGPLLNTVQPGSYDEAGVRATFVRTIFDNVTAGPTFTYFERSYNADIVPTTVDIKRHDSVVGPGAVIWIANPITVAPNVLSALKIEYQFYRDNSNDVTRAFDDHILSASMMFRF
jgi:hypothetical protein